MTVQTSRGFLMALTFIVFWTIWIQDISGSGIMQVSLISYIFSYRSGDTTVKPSVVSNVTIDADYITNYKPQWILAGVAGPDKRTSDVTSQTPLNASFEDWPWIGVAECSGTTQYRFIVCLDYEKSYDHQRPCALQRVQTSSIPIDVANMPPSAVGGESVTFGSYVLGAGNNPGVVSNPLRLEFTDWKDSVRISVYVNCCGENPLYTGQCKEMVYGTVDLWPRPFLGGTWSVRLRLSGRGSMMMVISANCDPSYFLPTCDLFCRVDNPVREHTFCNASSGRKQCLQGWSGPDCQTDINECIDFVCQNGGSCENRPGSFFCSCMVGTRGRFCEQRVPVCHLKPCHNNGSCQDMPSGTICLCAPGFNGQWCQMEIKDSHDLSRPREAAETSTRMSGSSPRPTSASVHVELSRVSTNKTDIRWRDWYLAVIFGVILLLVLIIIAAVVLHRIHIRNGYKVNLLLSSPGNSNTPTSEPQSDRFNNDVYQLNNSDSISQPNPIRGFSSDKEIKITDQLDGNDDEMSAEKAHFSGKHGFGTKSVDYNSTNVSPDQANEAPAYDGYDYLQKSTAQVDAPVACNVQTSLLIAQKNNTTQNKLNNVKNKPTFATGQNRVKRYTVNNAEVVLTKSDKGHFKGAYAVSSILKAFPASTGGDIHVGHCTLAVGDSQRYDSCDENIYEEIDVERIPHTYNTKMKEPSVFWSRSDSDLPGSGATHCGDDIPNTQYPGGEDEHGYLRPRDLVTPSGDCNERAENNVCIPLSNVYDYPRHGDGNTRACKHNEDILSTPQNNSQNKVNSASSHQSQLPSNGHISNCQDQAVFPISSGLQHCRAVCESVDHQVNESPIYANTSLEHLTSINQS